MIWLLAILVSCVTLSAEECNVTLLAGKVLQPKPSWDNGARFRSHLHTDTKEVCQQGCCGTERCDTILFTGSKVDKKGDNCFYFDCHGHCIFRDSNPQESNFSVAVVSQSTVHEDLPDFSNIFVSAKPIPDIHPNDVKKDNSTEIHEAEDAPVIPEKVTTPTNSTQSAEKEVKPDSAEQKQPESKSVVPPVQTSDTTVKDTTVKDTTLKPDVPATPKVETSKNDTVDAVPAKNDPEQTKPTQASSPVVNEPVTVKDNAEKPETSDVTPAPKPAKADPVKPAEAANPATEKEDAVPTEKPKPKLPNEVPAVKVNATESKTKIEEQSKAESKEKIIPAVVVVDKPKKSNTTKSATNVSVEVDIHTVQENDTDTKKDVVFWVAVVGGSSLIVLGLVIVIRYYGNKRRRLYSSLTDDYLINGMYSI